MERIFENTCLAFENTLLIFKNICSAFENTLLIFENTSSVFENIRLIFENKGLYNNENPKNLFLQYTNSFPKFAPTQTKTMSEININVLESEAGFRVLFEYATISIIVVGQEGRIELANPCTEGLFGYKNAELIGKMVEILIPESLHAKHIHHRDGYFAKPKSRHMGLGMELFAKKKDGTIFPVEISLGHYELAGEKLAVAFITDITVRKDAENNLIKINENLEEIIEERTLELTQALEREKELNEMKSRFVSIASHEFRTPLSAILSSVSLVESYIEKNNVENRIKHIQRIKSSVRMLTLILDDFLSLDKLEQGKMQMEMHLFNVTEFANDIIEEVHGMLKVGQQINYNHVGNTSIILDKKILRNILLNLLSNAIKYSGEGKEILLNIVIKDKHIKIAIKDNGIGIPEEDQNNIFGKFFRANNSGTIQGTGLGLNIVKRYVELLNGTISFISKQNEGTTFTIELNQNTH